MGGEQALDQLVVGEGQAAGRKLLGGKYDLDEGKINCLCLIRKWRFCPRIKEIANGRITPDMLKARNMKEVEEGGRTKLEAGKCGEWGE